ncbi:hypothetical protein Ddc_23739 [Ditylenchus destructor]|nr:hypothetical protein Ddc_23739 [Ditylenchus destructor]
MRVRSGRMGLISRFSGASNVLSVIFVGSSNLESILLAQTARADFTFTQELPRLFMVDPKCSGSYDKTCILNASVNVNHENWPLFQHFVRLLTDPFIYIRYLELSSQNNVLNLLAESIKPTDRGRLQCEQLFFYLEANSQKFMRWIKNCVSCGEFKINGEVGDLNYDQELLDLFLTGARCTSEIEMEHYTYEPAEVIAEFAQIEKQFREKSNKSVLKQS